MRYFFADNSVLYAMRIFFFLFYSIFMQLCLKATTYTSTSTTLCIMLCIIWSTSSTLDHTLCSLWPHTTFYVTLLFSPRAVDWAGYPPDFSVRYALLYRIIDNTSLVGVGPTYLYLTSNHDHYCTWHIYLLTLQNVSITNSMIQQLGIVYCNGINRK